MDDGGGRMRDEASRPEESRPSGSYRNSTVGGGHPSLDRHSGDRHSSERGGRKVNFTPRITTTVVGRVHPEVRERKMEERATLFPGSHRDSEVCVCLHRVCLKPKASTRLYLEGAYGTYERGREQAGRLILTFPGRSIT